MAYAALLSLMHDMDDAHYPVGYPPLLRQNTTASLRENVVFLEEFLQVNSHRRSQEMDALVARIRHAADAAQDLFESHMVDFTLAESAVETNEACTIFCVEVQFVIAEIECVKEEAMKIVENRPLEDQPYRFSGVSRSSRSSLPTIVEDTDMVGVDKVFNQIMDKITGHEKARKSLPIIGMGGIGKTTLARKIYDSQIVVDHFDVRAWTQLSQECNVHKVISDLLHDISVFLDRTSQEWLKGIVAFVDETSQIDLHELCEKLHKSLSGRRYLIILDDLWSIEAWIEIQRYFPDNSNGSRIIVTTRLSNVASQVDSEKPYQMSLLTAKESWELLHKHVFGEEGCPSELEEIGKTILKKCKGLPLAIVVVGGLLSKSNRDQEYWEHVAEDIDEILHSEDNDHCLNILYLSYIHLPVYLKPCFLYMGIFPEASYIRFSKLIKLWVSEGFLKPSKSKTLEEVAKEYLKEFIDRNLILTCRVGFYGELKGCRMHDLLRDLCLREARKENFFYVQTACAKAILATGSERRFIINQGPTENIHCEDEDTLPFPTLAVARSVVCNIKWHPVRQFITTKCRLLRIFDMDDILSVEDILQLVNSRYLAFKINATLNGTFPSSISRLRKLQHLITESSGSRPVSLPHEIWKMSQLRHLKFSLVCLPDPLDAQTSQQQDSCVLLENLQTLSQVLNMRTTLEIVRRIPNVKKLKLFYEAHLEWSSYCLNNLVHLHELESLTLTCVANGMIYPGELNFPPSLKKLTLLCCKFRWEDMCIVGSLPHLEVLVLGMDAFDGLEWKPNEGEFSNLKFLFISSSNLECWHAESEQFPKLEILALLGCLKLKEIPSGIGEIPTMKLISLCLCSQSAADSAREILKEQRSYDNLDLNVSVNDWTSIYKRLALVPPLYAGLSSWEQGLIEELEHWGNAPDHDEYELYELEHWGYDPNHDEYELNQLEHWWNENELKHWRNENEPEHCRNASIYYELSRRERIIFWLLVIFLYISYGHLTFNFIFYCKVHWWTNPQRVIHRFPHIIAPLVFSLATYNIILYMGRKIYTRLMDLWIRFI